jgi:hypothetical protein
MIETGESGLNTADTTKTKLLAYGSTGEYFENAKNQIRILAALPGFNLTSLFILKNV